MTFRRMQIRIYRALNKSGKILEKGVNKLDDHLQEATGLKGEVISAMQDLEKVYRQLDQI